MTKELLFSITKKDLKITFFSGRGAGGQHRNRHQNCVRIHHKESGVLVTGQSHREKRQNVKEALKNLVNHKKFKLWNMKKVSEILDGKSIEQKVEEMMSEENLKIEYYD